MILSKALFTDIYRTSKYFGWCTVVRILFGSQITTHEHYSLFLTGTIHF